MNSICERFLGSVRRECLDHVSILGEKYLDCVLIEYCAFFNTSRPHQGIGQQIPAPVVAKKFTGGATVKSIPVLAGLHHDYQVAA